ncbi:MAG: TonB-dependent receptor [Bacteroidia bacterium]|nr:TonB-dependent receptor [Bacteroidia bacterium]NNJ56417.1 TonB-dependent receptor [Bacteroidia bacterium]
MKNIIIIILILLAIPSIAQHEGHIIKGRVVSSQNDPVTGAYVRWMDKEAGVFTDSAGSFQIEHHHEAPYLIISFASYTIDTVYVKNMDSTYIISLKSDNEMETALIIGKRINYGLSRLSPRTTILLGEREFQKAACCNLSESFENSPAIDASFADAVTGTKQIKMLGLDGFYTLIGKEYMPAIRTLNSYYGLSLIPSSWIEGIQITKGAGSVVNGYESMAGQINIEMKKPFDKESFLFDQFVSEGGRTETDLMYRKDINKYVASSIFLKGAFRPIKNDRNNDGFLDQPLSKQFQAMNRWQFMSDKGIEGIASISYNNDTKEAGQLAYYDGDNNAYGIDLNTKQFDVFAKIGKAFKDKPYKSFGSQYAFNNTSFLGTYGNSINSKVYEAKTSSFYVNLLYQSIIKNTFHEFQTGISFQSDDMDEKYDGFAFQRTEIVPGAFFEYTYKPKETFSLVGGIRADYNSIFGMSVTPRFHSKYRFNKDKTAIRLSAGMGRRTSNPLAQNQQIFASSRTLAFINPDWSLPYGLEQEVSINSGMSFEHQFRLGYMPVTLGLDYFNTSFLSEVVLDRETANTALFYTVKNGTRANSFQSQVDLQPARRTEIRLAYRMFDVQTKYNDIGYLAKPFISKHRSFINVTQKTRNDWQFSSTGTWYGPQRIPGYRDYVLFELSDDYSPSFILLNAQISKTFKKQFEVYLGAENILNYKQDNPIEEAVNPFSENFDAGMVWGPIFGRMIYGGFRWRVQVGS